MNDKEFKEQVNRLVKQFGDKQFSGEKTELLYKKFGKIPSDEFKQVVDYIILNNRYSPVFSDYENAIQAVKKRINDIKMAAQFAHGPDGILDLPHGNADPDFVRLCQKTYSDYATGKITKKQFHEACNGLDELADRINPPNTKIKPNTQGLKIRSIVSCDRCGFHYWFIGTVIELAINKRLCEKCRQKNGF